jgi:alkylated DNA repair dioxygenase AlkB
MGFEMVGADSVGDSAFQNLNLTDADVQFFPSFLAPADSDRLFEELLRCANWKQEKIRWYGKQLELPRLTAWYGDEGKVYKYSGIIVEPDPWIRPLIEIKEKIEAVSGTRFNSVLLNLYRTGRDSVSWHSDDEPELGELPTIGSVSLGQTRPFHMRHKRDKSLRATVELTHGSFLLMKGTTQNCWIHEIPKSARSLRPRINLTFRDIKESADRRARRNPKGALPEAGIG